MSASPDCHRYTRLVCDDAAVAEHIQFLLGYESIRDDRATLAVSKGYVARMAVFAAPQTGSARGNLSS